MGRRTAGALSGRVTQEAARIICEDGLADFRLAKQKAIERLGLGFGTPLPSNADVQAAVLQYQRLFGGTAHVERLARMRATALQAMRLLAPFDPRLVGAVANGAATDGHRVQLHCFADKAEAVDLLLGDRGIPFDVEERRYRYPDGSTADRPVIVFDADGTGVAVAVFPESERRRAPLSPADGAPVQRLDRVAVEALVTEAATPPAA